MDLLDLLAEVEGPSHEQLRVNYPDGMTLWRCCGALRGSRNLARHLAGDDSDDLPQTFRDLVQSGT